MTRYKNPKPVAKLRVYLNPKPAARYLNPKPEAKVRVY
jgi:hypothetical protein